MKKDTSRRLTEEAEGPADERVEVAAVPRGHCLLRAVKLFGRVLDQEQHRLCHCDLVETEKTHTVGQKGQLAER